MRQSMVHGREPRDAVHARVAIDRREATCYICPLTLLSSRHKPPAIVMRTRPHSSFVQKLKARRCPKCGAKVNPQRKRCKRCSKVLSGRPKK
jgi:hypothetical protein